MRRQRRHDRSAFTLLEMLIAAIILVFLSTFALPAMRKLTEQERLDLASQRLAAIYTAQRIYFADNQAFAPSITALVNAKLLDPDMPPGSGQDTKFAYAVTTATAIKFTATATRASDTYWSGVITIQENGKLTGEITNPDLTIRLSPPTVGVGL
jgi:prepilin-type N-terminal cleavage/methylation domain-containing protein